MKADHFAFRVNDIDASIAFYTEKLGLKLMFKQFDENHHEAFAFLELEGGNLELLQLLDEENRPVPFERPPAERPYTPHLAIQSDDLDGLVVRLEQQGVPLAKGPLEIPGQVKWLYLCDPDNNIIEFVQWL